MCGLFGIHSYGFSSLDKNQLINILACESMERGVDATGFAYLDDQKIVIEKSALSAKEFIIKLPQKTNTIIGHTRRTTCGTHLVNENNHPFLGSTKKTDFALAHNGVLWNYKQIRKQHSLITPSIETDTYIAMQLLERDNEISFSSIRSMAENVEGVFTFSLLDDKGNLWLVKQDSPLVIAHFPRLNVYVYASTETILLRSLAQNKTTVKEISESLSNNQNYVRFINPVEGSILRINKKGEISKNFFDVFKITESKTSKIYFDERYTDDCFDDYFDILSDTANYLGFDDDIVETILSEYTLSEIEYTIVNQKTEELFFDLWNPKKHYALDGVNEYGI